MLDAAGPVENAPTTSALLTFLIADVRGYTSFSLERGDEAAARLASRFAEVTEAVIHPRGGRVIELRGDEALAMFPSARHALQAAVDLQERFAVETRLDPSLPLRVGIGLDAGEAVRVGSGYRGSALNLAARLCGLAGPGEVLASETVTNLARKMEGLRYTERGATQLKGFADLVRVMQITPDASAPREGVVDEEVATQQIVAQQLPIGGFLGSLPAGDLVAREEELRHILHAVDVVAHGEGRLLFLAGEPGIGKTRLAQEVTLHARNREFLVGSGRCYEPEAVAPYYPFREALGMLWHASPPTVRANIPRHWAYLSQLIPGEGEGPSAPAGDGQEQQQRLFHAVTGFIEALADVAPIALLLDDVHWADESSLRLLQYLTRHTRSRRILFLGTYRDVEVGRRHPLEAMLRDLNREGLLEEIAVRRLDQQETAALTASRFDDAEITPEFAELVYRHTEGNPFFTQEVLHALVERGDVFRQNGVWDRRAVRDIEVPKSIRSTIGERVSRLSDEGQSVLAEASVLGQSFNFDDLLGIADRTEEEIEEALVEAEAARLVRSAGPDKYSFNHALTQQVLYDEVSPRRRRRLHIAAGEALAGRSRDKRNLAAEQRTAELAYHFLQGDDPERALPYSLQAGDGAAAVFAHSEAAHHFSTAMELAAEMDDTTMEADAASRLGQALAHMGQYDDAVALAKRAAAIYRRLDDREQERRIIAQAVGNAVLGGTSDDAVLSRAAELLEDHEESLGMADLCVSIATDLWRAGHDDESLAMVERGAEIAHAVGAEWTLANAEVRRGTLLFRHDPAAAGRVLEDAIVIAERVGNLGAMQRALNNIAFQAEEMGNMERNLEFRQRALEVCERTSIPPSILYANSMVAHALDLLGRYDEAREFAQRGVDGVRAMGPSWGATYALVQMGYLCAIGGEWDAASAYLEEGLAIATRGHDVQGMGFARIGLACPDLLRGMPRAVIDRFEAAPRDQVKPWEYPVIAEAYLALGDGDGAATICDKILAANRPWQGEEIRVRGMVSAWRHDWSSAETDLQRALELARQAPYPLEEGRTLYEYGRMLIAAGSIERGVAQLREALSVYERIGAQAYVDLTRRTLVELS